MYENVNFYPKLFFTLKSSAMSEAKARKLIRLPAMYINLARTILKQAAEHYS